MPCWAAQGEEVKKLREDLEVLIDHWRGPWTEKDGLGPEGEPITEAEASGSSGSSGRAGSVDMVLLLDGISFRALCCGRGL